MANVNRQPLTWSQATVIRNQIDLARKGLKLAHKGTLLSGEFIVEWDDNSLTVEIPIEEDKEWT